eukprot:859902-Pyramimonas_sp.AAC.2
MIIGGSPKGSRSRAKLAPPTKTEYAASELEGLSADLGVKVIDSQAFDSMFAAAEAHERKRKMFDLTRNPRNNYLQQMVRTQTHTHAFPDTVKGERSALKPSTTVIRGGFENPSMFRSFSHGFVLNSERFLIGVTYKYI